MKMERLYSQIHILGVIICIFRFYKESQLNLKTNYRSKKRKVKLNKNKLFKNNM